MALALAKHDAVVPRARKWAPKVRTGCFTCRARRIKCDETQPVCRKCYKSNRPCQYGLRFLGQEGDQPPETELALAMRPPTEAIPPDWDYMQAVRYYITVCAPARPSEMNCHDPFGFRDRTGMAPDTFICMIVCTSLSNASRSRGLLLQPGENPAFAGLWQNYSRYMARHIRHVNDMLAVTAKDDVKAIRKSFRHLYTLLGFDILVNGAAWQLHINGCFAFAAHLGGPEALMGDMKSSYFVEIMTRAIMCNTTSPALSQVPGHYNYTDQQILTLLKDFISVDLPCPPYLIALMVRITRLRILAATTSPDQRTATIVQAAQDVLAEVDQPFGIDAWVTEFEFNNKDMGHAYAYIFHAAVKLYGTLTLPAPAADLIRHAADESTAHEALCTAQRETLVTLLKDAWPIMDFVGSLQWPLLVVGVAAATGARGAAADQAYVTECMGEIMRHPLSDSTTHKCLRKMQKFWAAGETEWEECFYEATIC